MASRMVDLPLPVSPQIRKIGESARGADVKSMLALETDAMLFMSSFLSFIIVIKPPCLQIPLR